MTTAPARRIKRRQCRRGKPAGRAPAAAAIVPPSAATAATQYGVGGERPRQRQWRRREGKGTDQLATSPCTQLGRHVSGGRDRQRPPPPPPGATHWKPATWTGTQCLVSASERGDSGGLSHACVSVGSVSAEQQRPRWHYSHTDGGNDGNITAQFYYTACNFRQS